MHNVDYRIYAYMYIVGLRFGKIDILWKHDHGHRCFLFQKIEIMSISLISSCCTSYLFLSNIGVALESIFEFGLSSLDPFSKSSWACNRWYTHWLVGHFSPSYCFLNHHFDKNSMTRKRFYHTKGIWLLLKKIIFRSIRSIAIDIRPFDRAIH